MSKTGGLLFALIGVAAVVLLYVFRDKEIIHLSAQEDVPAYAAPIQGYQESPSFVIGAGSSVAVSGCDIDKTDIRVVVSVSGRSYYVTNGEYELVRRHATFMEGRTDPMATSSCRGMLAGISRPGA